MTHQSTGNEVTPEGIVHRCSCGWVSRPCFSNMIASIEGQDHREAAGSAPRDEPDKPGTVSLATWRSRDVGKIMDAAGVQDQCPVCHVEGGQHQRGCRNASGEQKDEGTSNE